MNTLTVTQVNRYLKAVLDELPPIQNMYVMGEISNFKHYRQSGHMYFTLKDSTSQLKCVMFSSDNYKLRFAPEDGMNVVCFGKVGVYERDGNYQLYVHGMQPKGTGDLALAFEQLKLKLEEKGYFDENHKKPIPRYPSRIGVATSNMGAAVEDIKNVISRRYPLAEIIIVPTIVQGDEAPEDIAKSIRILDSLMVDTIIVGRGGGSLEDLWAFNTEIVANAVYNCQTPIISAVGHETDFTICDFVADVRAATPSVGAELAVPDIQSEKIRIDEMVSSMTSSIKYCLNTEQNRLDRIKKHSPLSNVNTLFDSQNSRIEELKKSITKSYSKIIETKLLSFQKNVAMLNALSPLAVLSRGYTITTKGNRSVNDVFVDDIITTITDKFEISSKVIEVKKNG